MVAQKRTVTIFYPADADPLVPAGVVFSEKPPAEGVLRILQGWLKDGVCEELADDNK